jgi:thioredoxin reductase
MHYALLVSNLTKDLVVLTNGPAGFADEQLAKLRNHQIPVIETEVIKIEHDNGVVRHVVLKDGARLLFDAVYFRPPFTQHCDIPQSLGCELTDLGYLKTDAMQKTTVDGVFACGDNASAMRSVANAVAAGNLTGAAVNKELAGEDF